MKKLGSHLKLRNASKESPGMKSAFFLSILGLVTPPQPCITGPFNTVAHLTSTSHPDPHHSSTSLRLNTLTHNSPPLKFLTYLTSTQHPGPPHCHPVPRPILLHSKSWPTSLSLSTLSLLASTHQLDPPHFSTQHDEFPPTEHMKTHFHSCHWLVLFLREPIFTPIPFIFLTPLNSKF